MKKLYTCWLFICGVIAVQAQQKPHYTQYVLNNYILNPALTGIENYFDVKVSARDQWVGLNGAPRTAYLSIQGPIDKEDTKTTATSFQLPGQNPRGESYWENYTPSKPHSGIGVILLNDHTGNFNSFTANVTYAYHIGITPNTNLAAGFGGQYILVYPPESLVVVFTSAVQPGTRQPESFLVDVIIPSIQS